MCPFAIYLCRGSALQKRLRDREKEMEADERDRKREKEELEEIRQRLLAEGHPDPDAELQRVRCYVGCEDFAVDHHATLKPTFNLLHSKGKYTSQ